MRLSLHPITPESRLMRKVLEVFANGGVIVYPTDSGYSLGCDALNKAAVNKLYHLKREIKKYYMALMMLDFGLVTEFAKVDTTAFRYMRKLVPGPYTFILPATTHGKKVLDVKRAEIGVRMPDCPFGHALSLIKPDFVLLTTAAKIREDENFTDPVEIDSVFGNDVDLVVDIGPVAVNPTTIISLVNGQPEVIREGAGGGP
ncbi:MAG TPA: threonylcarbamoyl-AMP synthase [Fibrobacteres bacterium]|nr:threonylcarbamoyl-AMP synthase [Fibrobacterota bacterium]